MYKSLMNSMAIYVESQLCLLRLAVASVDLRAAHRTAHAALGVAGGAYVEPTLAEQTAWLEGPGADATLPDGTVDLQTAISNHHCRHKNTTTANAETTARRAANRHKLLEKCNAQTQHALLGCVSKDPKFKHVQSLHEVKANLPKFGVVTTQ